MIRPASEADLPALVAMGQRFIEETAYASEIVADSVQLEKTARWLLAQERGVILVAERGHDLIGMIGFAVLPHPFSGEPTAMELFWWVEPEHRGVGVRLLKTCEQWARQMGATRLQMVAPNDHVAAFYERVGYGKVETAYARSL